MHTSRPRKQTPVSDPGISTAPAEPTIFDGLAGYFHDAPGETAVLLLNPWGYEELCSRKTYRILGESLAFAGFPCLRFDYPATGNASGEGAGIKDERAWRSAVRRALAELETLCRPRRVILAGQGIGGALAADLARETEVAGLVLMAPVAQGRAYLRELTAWTAMTKPTFLVDASDGPEGGLMAGGFVLSAATASELRSLNLMKDARLRAGRVLLVERPEHPADAKLAATLTEGGLPVDRIPFEGYTDYVLDPTLSRTPAATVERIVAWCSENFGSTARPSPGRAAPRAASAIHATDYHEVLLRFGPDRMFFGAFTKPAEATPRTALLFLNSGYDHSPGWGRMVTGFARALAGEGLASLRMDLAGIGESRLWPGQPEQVLYSDRQKDDVKAALDWLLSQDGIEKVLLVGRCSGAYLALVAAEADGRVSGAFLVNSRRLVWNPEEDVEAALREPLQTLSTYRRKMVDRQMLRKALSGELSLARAAGRLFRALHSAADKKLAPLMRGASRHHRLGMIVQRRFQTLRERGTPIQFLYSRDDSSLLELEAWFGADCGKLSRYGNVELAFVENADHNMTPLPARAELLDRLRTFAKRFQESDRPALAREEA